MKKIIQTIIVYFIATSIFAQNRIDTLYYDANWKICDSISASFLTISYYEDSSENNGSIKTLNVLGKIISECKYFDLAQKKRENCKYFHENGTLKSILHYKNGKLHGELNTYYNSGQIKRRDVYDNGKLVDGKCYSSTGNDTTYFDYISSAIYPGGDLELFKIIYSNLNYPQKAINANIAGKVIVKFTIDKEGIVKEPVIEKSIHPLLDEEALRVVSLIGKWTPSLEDGEKISIVYRVPINFKIE
jgi:protein TonB